MNMKRNPESVRAEMNIARRTWGELGAAKFAELRALVRRNRVSVALGDVCYIENRWYITHSGLLRLAHRKRCAGIKTYLDKRASDPVVNRWVFKAIVYTSSNSAGFFGYGDADPSNTSPLVRGAEMRVAETRAVSRALRKAYGVGLCSVEELGSFSGPPTSFAAAHGSGGQQSSNGSGNGQPRLRDQLCLLIRQHNLDPTLVKAYAADFCGTETLREASRDLVESFITQLAASAKEDRDALLSKLNSYAQSGEVKQ
jgi:hypothetical protein